MGQFTSIISSCFPCMSKSTDPNNTTITIHSTSACCRGKLIQVTIDKSHKDEFDEIIKKFIEKISEENQTIKTEI